MKGHNFLAFLFFVTLLGLFFSRVKLPIKMCSIVVLIPPTLNRKSLQGIHIIVNKFSANTTSIYATRVRSYFQKLPILRLPLLLQLGGENMPKLFNLDPEKTINRHLMSGNPQVKYQTAFSTHGENIHPEMLLQLVLTN